MGWVLCGERGHRNDGMSANRPIDTGGRLQAIHGLEAGKADEARAEARDVEDAALAALFQLSTVVGLWCWRAEGRRASSGVA